MFRSHCTNSTLTGGTPSLLRSTQIISLVLRMGCTLACRRHPHTARRPGPTTQRPIFGANRSHRSDGTGTTRNRWATLVGVPACDRSTRKRRAWDARKWRAVSHVKYVIINRDDLGRTLSAACADALTWHKGQFGRTSASVRLSV